MIYLCYIKIIIMKTIIFLSLATIGMSSNNIIVMLSVLLICTILTFKNEKK